MPSIARVQSGHMLGGTSISIYSAGRTILVGVDEHST